MVTRPKHRARIKAQKTGDFLPFNSSHAAARLGLPLKPSIILIRWPVVIIASYLLLYPATRYLPESFFHAFILLYVISNVALYFLDDPWFGSWSFYYPLVITDTLVLTMSLIINGRAALDDRDRPALSLLKVTVALPTFYRECFMNIIDLDLPSRRPICGGKEWKRIV